MKDNELKEKIRKNIKEEIAISNIGKEFDMKTNKNKKVIYVLSSICAVFILGIGIFVGVNHNLLLNNTVDIGQTDAKDGVELNINKIKDMAMTTLDADMYIVTFEYNNIYFDIETTGITENQLVDLLESIIDNSTNGSTTE